MAERLRVVRRTAGGFRPVHLQIYAKKSRIFRSVAEKSVFFGIRFVLTPVERNGRQMETELNMLDLNVRAVQILTKLFLADFRKRGSGRILNVASSAGFLAGGIT